MNIKIALIVVLTVLLTVVMMNNTETVNFWFFGSYLTSKLNIIAFTFATGFIVGALVGWTKRQKRTPVTITEPAAIEGQTTEGGLSQEDRDYIN